MAAKGIGKLFQVGVAKEVTRGTIPATVGYWLAFSEASIEEKYKNAIDVESYGVVEDSASQTRTSQFAEGDIKAPLADQSLGLLLYSLLGAHTVTGTGPYVHVFKVGQSAQHQSLSLYIHDPLAAQDYAHANGMVSKLDIEYSKGKFITYTAHVFAQKGTQETAYTPSQTMENRFVPQYLTFKLATNLAGLTAATPTVIMSAKLTIDSMVEAYDALGSVAPQDFLNKEFSVDGQIEAIWQNESDFKTAALANTAQAMRLDLINADVTLTPSGNPELQINLAKVYFTEFSRPIKLKDFVTQTVKFKAAYSISDSEMLDIALTNSVATY